MPEPTATAIDAESSDGPTPTDACDLCGPPIDLTRGGRLSLRHSRPGDTAGLRDLYHRLDRNELRYRFFTGGQPTERFLERWAAIEAEGGFGLLAEVSEGGESRLVGEAGYGPTDRGEDCGELGITVDRHSRGWLGPWLLDRLLAHAARRGVTNLQAVVLLENRAMLALAAKRGYAVTGHPDWSTVQIALSTSGSVPGWPNDHHRPRVLIETDRSRPVVEQAMADAGFELAVCGEICRPERECPVFSGEPCPLIEGADVVIIDLPDAERVRDLLQREKLLHPGIRHLVAVDPASGEDRRPSADELAGWVRDLLALRTEDDPQ